MLLELKNINKTYFTKTGVSFRALSNVSVSFDDTGLVFILGKSGSGKSTLLNIIGALDRYDSGEMIVGDKNTKRLSGNSLDYYRNSTVGFVFQEYNLIDSLSVLENVRLALDLKGEGTLQERKNRATEILERFGIADKARVKARNISGGQRQRVAIARALVKDPRIILADEPTGSLDSATGGEILGVLREIANTRLVIAVTHDAFTAAKYGDRIIEMKDGGIFRDVRRRRDGESLAASGVDIVSNTLVRLERGAEIDGYYADQINEIISASGRKAFLNIDSDINRTKALFPNLRDSVRTDGGGEKSADGAEIYKTEDLLGNEEFVPFTPDGSPPARAEFKRSRISPLSTLKMGFHNLRLKKFRLAMILVVTIISFTMFGAATILSNSRMNYSLARSASHDRVKAVSVSKNLLYSYDNADVVYDNMLDGLKSKYPRCGFYKQVFANLAPSSYRPASASLAGYTFDGFVGITEIDDMSKLGFSVIYGTSKPVGKRDAVISSYAAEALIAGGAFGSGAELSSLAGRTIDFNAADVGSEGFRVIVAGIYETTYKPFEMNDKMIVDVYNHAFQLFAGVDSGFMAEYSAFTTLAAPAYADISVDGESASLPLANQPVLVGKTSDALLNMLGGYASSDGIGALTPSDGREGILLILNGINAGYLAEINRFNASGGAYINIGRRNDYTVYSGSGQWGWGGSESFSMASDIIKTFHSGEYYIEGYILSQNCVGIALKENAYNEYIGRLAKYKQFLVCLSPSERENAALFEDLFKMDMQINADFSFYYMMYMAIFKNFESVIMGAAIAFSVLASLLTFNFISTSIRLTKRSIGLLRALGVNKLNTFLVYVMEGLVIALLTFAASAAALLIAVPIINASLSAFLGVYMPLLVFMPIVFVSMLALSFAVSLLAIFVPWFKYTKIMPVEAISDRV